MNYRQVSKPVTGELLCDPTISGQSISGPSRFANVPEPHLNTYSTKC